MTYRITEDQAHETDSAEQSQAAFNRAIRAGRMTERSAADYMFMGFDEQGRATFKHRMTRQYLPHGRASRQSYNIGTHERLCSGGF